jgi:hypothetical protein
MAPDRVKFHYRKAMLLLHPDKNVNGSVEQRFIAEKVRTRMQQCLQGLDSLVMCLTRLYMVSVCQVFTCVNDAYQSFAAQELK